MGSRANYVIAGDDGFELFYSRGGAGHDARRPRPGTGRDRADPRAGPGRALAGRRLVRGRGAGRHGERGPAPLHLAPRRRRRPGPAAGGDPARLVRLGRPLGVRRHRGRGGLPGHRPAERADRTRGDRVAERAGRDLPGGRLVRGDGPRHRRRAARVLVPPPVRRAAVGRSGVGGPGRAGDPGDGPERAVERPRRPRRARRRGAARGRFWTAATFKGTVDELAGPAVRVLGGPPRGAGAAVRRRVRGVPVPTAPAWTGPLARMAVSTSNRPHRTRPTGILGP